MSKVRTAPKGAARSAASTRQLDAIERRANALKRIAAAGCHPDLVLTTVEVAAWLNTSNSTVDRLEDLPRITLSPGRRAFRLGSVIEWAAKRSTGAGA